MPGLDGLYRTLSPYSYAFMRLSAGLVLMPHGIAKLFFGGAAATAHGALGSFGPTWSLAIAYGVGTVELFGGLFLAIGLFTRLAALSIVTQMTVIIFFFLWPNGYFWTKQGFEYALLWDLLAVAIFFRGGGRYSIDRFLPREF
jgi:putative oxidoreductase